MTALGVRRFWCIRCRQNQAQYQWYVCCDGSYRPMCRVCDLELNRLSVVWMRVPIGMAKKWLAKYRRRLLS